MTLVPDVLAGLPRQLYIDGRWVDAAGAASMAVEDPATGMAITSVADASAADGRAALDAACAAQDAWAATAPRVRGELLRAAFESVRAERERFAELIALEMGKPLADARAEVDYGAEFLRWFSEEAVRIGGEYRTAPDGASRIVVSRVPVGPCLLVTPWNFPLAMITRKIAPALAAGCTAVLKPAPQTPLTALALLEVLIGVGVPAGVVNLLTTSDAEGVCAPLIADGRVRKLSFTGSTAVGRQLVAECAPQLMRVSMELGGNAPFIVLADADLDAAADGALVAKMRNMGEACTAANRFYVEEAVLEPFTQRLVERMAGLKIGPGAAAGSQVGPLIDDVAVERVERLVADAVQRGAEVRTGAEQRSGPGHFYPPTVLTGVPEAALMLHEEIFGPVAPIVGVGDAEEAVRLANDTEYGLIAYLYTGDVGRGLRLAERLQVGMVGLNRGVVSNAAAPFGGVKQSGMGREGGREGIDEYLDVRYTSIDV